MILFFRKSNQQIYAVEAAEKPLREDIQKLRWLFGNAEFEDSEGLAGR